MRKIIIHIFISLMPGFYSCNNQNPISSPPVNNNFVKVLTVDSLNYRFELYNNSDSILYVGYNEIGIKVYVDGAEKTGGFVKYKATMRHLAGPGHSTPVKNVFEYDAGLKMFMGYVNFTMLSDSSTSFWLGDYNYNNEFEIKQRNFDVVLGTGSQMGFSITCLQPEFFCLH